MQATVNDLGPRHWECVWIFWIFLHPSTPQNIIDKRSLENLEPEPSTLRTPHNVYGLQLGSVVCGQWKGISTDGALMIQCRHLLAGSRLPRTPSIIGGVRAHLDKEFPKW
jgi:hypothetical protein